MATTTDIKNLIINKVESQTVFNYMLANGLISEDELYLIQGEDSAILFTPQTLTDEQIAQVKVNLNLEDSDIQVIVDTSISAHNTNEEAHANTFAKKLDKSGDTMTGTLTLAKDPVENLEAATKQYVDTKVPDVVTTETNGLMLSNDKIKLNNIENYANNTKITVKRWAIID